MNVTTNPTVRVSLVPGGTSPGPLDGAWWPHSRDLTLELPLTTEFRSRWGPITRGAVHPAFWPVIPRRVRANGRVLRVGRFTRHQDPHALLLLSLRVARWDLLVIPPDTPTATAARLMASACDPRNVRTASGLMAAAAADREAQEADWEAEGGRVHTSRGERDRMAHAVPDPREGG
jgi:hypothetical protein